MAPAARPHASDVRNASPRGRSAGLGRLLALLLALATSFALTTPPLIAQDRPEGVRLAGPTRFDTSAAIARATLDGVPSSSDVVIDLVQDKGWHAPLVVSSWSSATASFRPAAMLLLPVDGTIPDTARAIISEYAAAGFTVVGDGAFVPAVQEAVSAITGQDAPFGFVVDGVEDVEELSAQFAADVADSSPDVNLVMLASADTAADALTAGPLAGQAGLLVITRADRLNPAFEQRAGAFRTVTIIGGTAAVPQAHEDVIRAQGADVVRVAGSNRFLTALAVADRLRAGGATDGADIGLARADEPADAIAAGPHAVHEGSPILLTGSEGLPADYTPAAIGGLVGCAGRTFTYGGTAALSDTPAAQMAELRC